MIKNTKLRSKKVKRAHELIYTAERQASRDVGLAGLRLKPGSSQYSHYNLLTISQPTNIFTTYQLLYNLPITL
jgi:hypothetical protein